MTARPDTGPVVARLSAPGEVLAALPSLCGFPPSESLVLLSLRGPRRRVGLTLRADLPAPSDEPAVADLAVGRMRLDGASAVVVAVYSEHGRREALVDALRSACEADGIAVGEALHVAGGRWTSYTCTERCCPAAGTPVPTDTPALRLIEAERALTGRAVLGSREDLVRALAPPALVAARSAQQAVGTALREWGEHRSAHGLAASRQRTAQLGERLLRDVERGAPVGLADAAALAVALADVRARDALAVQMLDRSDALLSLLTQVVQLVPPPEDAPACALLAWTAYGRGNGAVANVALDRALASQPDHALAGLLRASLDGGITPDEVRAVVRGTAEVLAGRSPRRRGRGGR